MYQWLDVPARSCQALQAAAECLFLCEAPEWVLQGFRWLSLARNQRLLPWRPPDTLDEKARAPRFSALPGAAFGQVSEDGEDGAFRRGVTRWWERGGAPKAAARRDPGCALADDYYALYGPGIEWAFGTGAVSVELLAAETEDAVSPRRGGVVDALFEMAARRFSVRAAPPARVLDLGCGAGAEAVYLAARGFDVVGVDSSAWAIQRAEERASRVSGPGRARFLCRDATVLSARSEGMEGEFDWVLPRDSLGHFVQKERALGLAASCAKPGGVLIGSDWIQRRTASRWSWWRLFETVWYAAVESEMGMARLLSQVRPALEGIHIERRDEEMRAFFEHRLAWVTAAAQTPASSTDEMAVRLRAQTDIAAMRDLVSQDGPVGWLFFTARRPAGA